MGVSVAFREEIKTKWFLYPKGIGLGFNSWRDWWGKEGRFGFGRFYLIGFKGVLRFVIHFYLIWFLWKHRSCGSLLNVFFFQNVYPLRRGRVSVPICSVGLSFAPLEHLWETWGSRKPKDRSLPLLPHPQRIRFLLHEEQSLVLVGVDDGHGVQLRLFLLCYVQTSQ